MTRAVFSRRGERWRVEMNGHADYDPGHDVVCAGCSAIVYALANYLRGVGAERLEERLEPGEVRLEAVGDGAVAAAFQMAAVGLEEIARQYPEHVQVKKSENFF